jgi:cytochrome c
MKKVFVLLSLCVAIAACGGGSEKAENKEDSTEASNQVAESRNQEVDTNVTNIGTDRSAGDETASSGASDASKGKDLIAKSDCLSCHRENEKLVGPAYNEVAAKYEDNDKNLDYLAKKIIEGGQGVWGQVPMTPHPAISKDDAKEMAKYVLSLK